MGEGGSSSGSWFGPPSLEILEATSQTSPS
jgi:hypothetical protein